MASDNGSLLHEDFDYSIENLREQGQLKQSDAIEVDQDDLVNIVGNVVHSQPCSHGNLFQPFVGFAGNPDDLCIL